MGDFNGRNYKDSFIGDLVDFVAGDDFQTMFEKFFLQHALEFTNDEEHKLSDIKGRLLASVLFSVNGNKGPFVHIEDFVKAGADKAMKPNTMTIDNTNKKVIAKFEKFNYKK